MCDFIPYIELIHGWKYTPQNYYKHILRQYNRSNPNKTYRNAYDYLQSNINKYIQYMMSYIQIPWQLTSFGNVWTNITRNNIDINIDIDHKTYNRPNRASAINILNIILQGLQQKEIFDLLNRLSNETNKVALNITRIPWGDSIKAILSIMQIIHKLNAYPKHKIAQRQKQTLFTSIIDIDAIGNDNTKYKQSLLYKLHPNIRKDIIKDCIQYKSSFFDQNSLTLYNPKYDKTLKGKRGTHPLIETNIINWWTDKTDPSPSYQDSIIIDKDDNNNNIRHQIHSVKESIIEFYELWKSNNGNNVCTDLNKTVPSISVFYNLKPKFVKCSVKIDYNLCSKCFNFGAALSAYYDILSANHTCQTSECIEFDEIEMGTNCNCNDCNNCIIASGTFQNGKQNFISSILCENDHEFADLNCVDGKCHNHKCGAKIISAIHNGDLCHTCHVDINTNISYSTVRKLHQRSMITTKTIRYFQFQIEFKSILKDFIKHSSCKRIVNNIRSHMSGTGDKEFLLPRNAVTSSFDFIGNPMLEQRSNTTNSMMNQTTVSMLQIYQVRNIDGDPQKYSYCYLCDNPKHKWTMALIACKHYFRTVQSQMNNTVEIFYNYSDRSTKDFSNTSFLAFLTHIWKEIGVAAHWYFTCPEEGKWLHDQCGGGNKAAYKRGINKNAVNFSANESPSITIKNYLISHFNQPRFMNSNITRYFYTIDANKISNIASPHETLKGIMSFHAFKYVDKNKIKYRRYPCFQCPPCIENNSDQCLYSYICGEWINKTFADLPFPELCNVNNNMDVDDRDNVDILPPIPSLQHQPSAQRYRYNPYAHDHRNDVYDPIAYANRLRANHNHNSSNNNNNSV